MYLLSTKDHIEQPAYGLSMYVLSSLQIAKHKLFVQSNFVCTENTAAFMFRNSHPDVNPWDEFDLIIIDELHPFRKDTVMLIENIREEYIMLRALDETKCRGIVTICKEK